MTAVAMDSSRAAADSAGRSGGVADDDRDRAIAVVASESGGVEAVVAYARAGWEIDQLVVISGAMTDAALTDLGELPKLFVARGGRRNQGGRGGQNDGHGGRDVERAAPGAGWRGRVSHPKRRGRLGFAVAVSFDPEILMVDEVIAVGDEALSNASRAR